MDPSQARTETIGVVIEESCKVLFQSLSLRVIADRSIYPF